MKIENLPLTPLGPEEGIDPLVSKKKKALEIPLFFKVINFVI